MLFPEFRAKLTPYFTPEQIGHLDAEAATSALVVLDRPRTVTEMAVNIGIGREVVLRNIWDAADDADYIAAISRSPMDPIKHAALIADMDAGRWTPEEE